jgi:cytochrome c oxidase subunit II
MTDEQERLGVHPRLETRQTVFLSVLAITLALLLLEAPWGLPRIATAGAQDGSSQQEFTVVARKYSFSPARIEVQQNDLVKITFSTEDIPHSFTVDRYRIAKRAGPGQTVVFEFRADQVGTFPYYCNLAIDDGCREMRGELIVRAR